MSDQNNRMPEDLQVVSDKVIDLLVDTTFKKHGVNPQETQVDEETRSQLRELVEDLQKSVKSLQEHNNGDN
ncbi:hypothetical protein [Alkalibacillus haloalkaliphilus]|uniref:Spore coat protein n=1 Tax=Alkalibacillus haloalkaliphilus TaxID=94136 RepID=A0A511W030_9BACI|nr:hypothetical protein [Alkalibacillus haloalkaliphilus]GEN44440.1 hypothetical protein AHA02nite_02160 [Alkalibacillus haloalkaliphilus]